MALQHHIDTKECAMACRDCCGHWQMYVNAFVTVIPKIDFSLFVVFLSSVLERLAKAPY
jgi:hypothetical protein